jgi:hypothetical protein
MSARVMREEATGIDGVRRRPCDKSLVVQDEAVAVPHQDLHPVEPPAEKNEQVSLERIELPLLADQRHPSGDGRFCQAFRARSPLPPAALR